MRYCEKHKVFCPVACQSCAWDWIFSRITVPEEALKVEFKSHAQAQAERDSFMGIEAQGKNKA